MGAMEDHVFVTRVDAWEYQCYVCRAHNTFIGDADVDRCYKCRTKNYIRYPYKNEDRDE